MLSNSGGRKGHRSPPEPRRMEGEEPPGGSWKRRLSGRWDRDTWTPEDSPESNWNRTSPPLTLTTYHTTEPSGRTLTELFSTRAMGIREEEDRLARENRNVLVPGYPPPWPTPPEGDRGVLVPEYPPPWRTQPPPAKSKSYGCDHRKMTAHEQRYCYWKQYEAETQPVSEEDSLRRTKAATWHRRGCPYRQAQIDLGWDQPNGTTDRKSGV